MTSNTIVGVRPIRFLKQSRVEKFKGVVGDIKVESWRLLSIIINQPVYFSLHSRSFLYLFSLTFLAFLFSLTLFTFLFNLALFTILLKKDVKRLKKDVKRM